MLERLLVSPSMVRSSRSSGITRTDTIILHKESSILVATQSRMIPIYGGSKDLTGLSFDLNPGSAPQQQSLTEWNDYGLRDVIDICELRIDILNTVRGMYRL